MNFNNFLACILVLMMNVFSSSAIAQDNTGVRLEFIDDAVVAYPGPMSLWKTHIPVDLDKDCLLKAAESKGTTISCPTTKKMEALHLKFGLTPLSRDMIETHYQVTIDSGQPSFVKQKKRWVSTDQTISFFWLIIPGIILLVASISNIGKGASRKKLFDFYLAITILAIFMAVVGVVTGEATLCLIVGGIVGLIVGAITGDGPDPLAGILVGSITGTFAAILGWQNGAITEYLVFLVSICFIGFLIREIAAFIAGRKKAKIEQFYH